LLRALFQLGKFEQGFGVVNGLGEFVEGAGEGALLVGLADGFAGGVGGVPEPGGLGFLVEFG